MLELASYAAEKGSRVRDGELALPYVHGYVRVELALRGQLRLSLQSQLTMVARPRMVAWPQLPMTWSCPGWLSPRRWSTRMEIPKRCHGFGLHNIACFPVHPLSPLPVDAGMHIGAFLMLSRFYPEPLPPAVLALVR